ncbi:MAG: hypothetical protein A2W52_01585 [Candidatus Taylorbacteria bacterium RIFCSPHIGHO2_02_49_25]|uniref:Polymerase beta nucleotidyltransferase domain-containing protein n=1 Tax=Candidatus Taylorbacteria bacterium RIFCSPHIGHO2_02_49_25 TaxID=1802305 RepID=A0A1G2MBF2_9BACT|nr:MAG: hypothetical protein UY62_C0038G0001 [Parcubacteria group bacterium GW2011_GWF2_50_9]OHA21034.1 MAG: hypothetical protein A2W52_01585 [Candidatus Taylorbacteria bacterium RIFCSPHIGHO2_02_49_25]OHA37440.1 MAG: hypothetical protein A2W65_03695 [Candidatus Taylorbacteria bacterium RIFCSPLOWO2_02_50_13]HCB35377.1 hypothetical protein [Candidatus Taylorbacteria bacterium]
MTDEQKKKIAEIAGKHNLQLIVLFGSQATGRTHKKSDVDIGFVAEREIDSGERFAISSELARIFQNPEVELVNLNNVSPELKRQVADQGILLYESRPQTFDLFKIHAHRIYMETKPLRVYRDARLNNFLKKYAG